MRRLATLFLTLFAALALPVTAHANIPASDPVRAIVEQGSERFVSGSGTAQAQGLAVYGPFLVVSATRAVLVDVTDSDSPARFAAMMRAHPGIAVLEMLDSPGTYDDIANLRLGRMIREAGLATYVPAHGSVRSGGVELFLAGARRIAHPKAEFAVHAWEDEDGPQATDYAADAPENAKYLAYYAQMGMSAAQARAFYAMTNSVAHGSAHWFDGAEMARWVRLDGPS